MAFDRSARLLGYLCQPLPDGREVVEYLREALSIRTGPGVGFVGLSDLKRLLVRQLDELVDTPASTGVKLENKVQLLFALKLLGGSAAEAVNSARESDREPSFLAHVVAAKTGENAPSFERKFTTAHKIGQMAERLERDPSVMARIEEILAETQVPSVTPAQVSVIVVHPGGSEYSVATPFQTSEGAVTVPVTVPSGPGSRS